ncbi:hypothetical protein FHS56_002192 [Thermonema lapsum]|uniref:Type 1 periplasmic binding fold superfamily protein n=1 Tax=Thermonema lapsum TaxID=28195 RepID=A0A846MSX0_9BACT|nr:type 1 periplasmic binding fold superfamily protein [Thermonema lapsum]NIK74663.1 hypothetical protein [Thermonema lapsum]
MRKQVLFSTLLAASVALTACKKDDPKPVNESELITTVEVTFTNQDDDSDVVTIRWYDEDGDGPANPVITNGNLRGGATYNAQVKLLDESKSPAKDITAEIRAEAEEHQLYYGFSNALFSSFEYLDQDANGRPLGLSFRVSTAPNRRDSENFTVLLIHEGDKSKNNASSPWVYNQLIGGEVDVQADFKLNLQFESVVE